MYINIVLIYLLCMIKARVRWCTSVENVITLGKLIGLLFCPPSSLFCSENSKKTRNDIARPVMGTIFLEGVKFGINFMSCSENGIEIARGASECYFAVIATMSEIYPIIIIILNGYNCTRKWLNCTRLRLVKLPRHFLVQLYLNYTHKHL